MTLVPVPESPALCFSMKGAPPVNFSIIAFNIDGDTVKPICWPTPPRGAKVFLRSSGGYQDFDLATGLASGPFRSSVE